MSITFIKNDGGRHAAGFRGRGKDCVTRAIAIATETDYEEVYYELHRRQKAWAQSSRSWAARQVLEKGTARTGVYRNIYQPYLAELGWKWVPVSKVGKGCTMHVKASELPNYSRLILRLSRHLTAVVDKKLHDTYDCSRGGTRCVYGYFRKKDPQPSRFYFIDPKVG